MRAAAPGRSLSSTGIDGSTSMLALAAAGRLVGRVRSAKNVPMARSQESYVCNTSERRVVQSANTSRLSWTKKRWSWPTFGSLALYFAEFADPSGTRSSE
jgi:hypothetical protein